MSEKTITNSYVLPKSEIISNKVRVEQANPTIGVYFLISDEEIVYVGQSINIESRILSHIGSKKFDSYSIIPCEESLLSDLEADYIIKFNPKYNLRLPKSKYMSKPVVKKEFNIPHMGVANRLFRMNGAKEYLFNGVVYYNGYEIARILEANNG